MASRKRDVWFYLGVGVFALYAMFLLYPLVNLLIKSVQDGERAGSVREEHYRRRARIGAYYIQL